jgi:uncharacterized membrane protein HdeD (DUF308 family)
MQLENDHNAGRERTTYRPYGQIIRGAIFVIFGLLILANEQYHFMATSLQKPLSYYFGGAVILYGLYRLVSAFVQMAKNNKTER